MLHTFLVLFDAKEDDVEPALPIHSLLYFFVLPFLILAPTRLSRSCGCSNHVRENRDRCHGLFQLGYWDVRNAQGTIDLHPNGIL